VGTQTHSIALIVAGLLPEYQFRFDKHFERWQGDKASNSYPWPIIPIWTEQSELPKPVLAHLDTRRVNFIIKLNKTVDVINDLKCLEQHPSMLLFLRHVSKILIKYGKVEQHIAVQSPLPNIKRIQINGKPHSEWLLHKVEINIPEAIQQQLRLLSEFECPQRLKDARKTQLIFACNIHQSRIDPAKQYLLHAYLPTDVNCGLLFLANADLILNAERTHINDNVWNTFIFGILAEQQLLWLASLANSKEYRFDVLKLLSRPTIDGVPSSCSNAYKKTFSTAIEQIRFIPSEQDEDVLLTLSEAFIDSRARQ